MKNKKTSALPVNRRVRSRGFTRSGDRAVLEEYHRGQQTVIILRDSVQEFLDETNETVERLADSYALTYYHRFLHELGPEERAGLRVRARRYLGL